MRPPVRLFLAERIFDAQLALIDGVLALEGSLLDRIAQHACAVRDESHVPYGALLAALAGRRGDDSLEVLLDLFLGCVWRHAVQLDRILRSEHIVRLVDVVDRFHAGSEAPDAQKQQHREERLEQPSYRVHRLAPVVTAFRASGDGQLEQRGWVGVQRNRREDFMCARGGEGVRWY